MDKNRRQTLSRREFIKSSMVGLATIPALSYDDLISGKKMKKEKVILIRTQNREEGVQEVLKLVDFPPVKGRQVMLKPNFNTADPTPGSTHNDTLAGLIKELKGRGAAEITVGERSGPPPTQGVMEQKGIFQLAEELGFKIINFEELEKQGLDEKNWVHFNPSGTHWKEGFYIPKPVVDAEYVVSTCCLKTHGFGGVFSMSLKLAVGLTPKSLMRELHSQRQGPMRKMIAEINQGYRPQLIVLDGIDAFVDGGPSRGTMKEAGLFLAGKDRVAIDAVGVAVLKELGSNEAIMGSRIFEQEQIQRAAELGLGVSAPDQIEIITPDKPSREYAKKLESILAQG
ncbi:MAG: DUF362 domain-containing protein [Candidatus Aminicenantes bacterium]|nr:DUF362 domain-containing protein [Candidatus Aminicenantes bacterium]MDH5706263.1 DUF362 domain-containing protein [Candidatus Aminicenantes bacterium]